MWKYALKRLLEAIPVLLIILTLTFVMTRAIPGSPFANEKISAEALARKEAQYGLDKPYLEQYVDTFQRLLSGELESFSHPGWMVNEIIAERLPVSLELGFWALLVAVIVGVGAGLLSSIRPNSLLDHTCLGLAMTGICLPTFVIGPILILVFSLELDLFSVWGWELTQDRVLPAITLGIFYAAYIARLTRTSMIEVGQLDYIRTARAKGLSEANIQLRHALRNALPPVLSFLGPAAAGLITGSFVVETIFHIPGLGQVFVESALNHSNNLLLALVSFYASLIILFNLLVDIALALVNPKVRLGKE